MTEGKIIIEGKNLSKDFNGNVVLRNVSIRCEAGRAIALVGENGAGKSTLMNIISGSLAPSAGSVWVDGREVRFTSPEQAKALLAEAGYDEKFGARPLRRAIQRQVEDALSEEIISGRLKLGDSVQATVEDGRLKLHRLPPEPALTGARLPEEPVAEE